MSAVTTGDRLLFVLDYNNPPRWEKGIATIQLFIPDIDFIRAHINNDARVYGFPLVTPAANNSEIYYLRLDAFPGIRPVSEKKRKPKRKKQRVTVVTRFSKEIASSGIGGCWGFSVSKENFYEFRTPSAESGTFNVLFGDFTPYRGSLGFDV